MPGKILHILNGDGTAGKFINSGIEGDYIVWREILSEGPVCRTEPELWDLRANYIHEVYGVNHDDYKKNIKIFFNKLKGCRDYDEVVLWFEFDLLCQINLIYLLVWFSDSKIKDINLSLVSVDSFPGINNFLGIGQLTSEQIASLFPQRIKINGSDLMLARNVWMAYASDHPEGLLRFLDTEPKSLRYLSKAITAHLERFPSIENGLNRIERKILKIVEQKPRQRGEIFNEFWKTESIYGMGDLQILSNIDLLLKSSLLSGDKVIKITDPAQSVLSSKIKFTDVNSFNKWNGGVHLKGVKDIWYWDGSNRELIRK